MDLPGRAPGTALGSTQRTSTHGPRHWVSGTTLDPHSMCPWVHTPCVYGSTLHVSMGPHFMCLWVHTPCVPGSTLHVSMGPHSMCPWVHTPCVPGSTLHVSMGPHFMCLWVHTSCVYGFTLPVSLGPHSMCLWVHTPCVYGSAPGPLSMSLDPTQSPWLRRSTASADKRHVGNKQWVHTHLQLYPLHDARLCGIQQGSTDARAKRRTC